MKAGRRRIWLIVGTVLLAIFGIALGVFTYYANRLEPIARERIVQYLAEHFQSDVELREIKISALPRLHVVGKGLQLRWKHRTDVPPMINLGEFSFNVGWEDLTGPIQHISLIRLKDFELNMPPKSTPSREAAPGEQPKPKVDQVEEKKPRPGTVVVDQIIADKTMLRLLPRDPNKATKDFELYELRLLGVGGGRSFTYRTKMKNYKPPGIIDCIGQFGPWVGADPGETSLSGDYTFHDADLGVFKGIAGILQAKGKFKGELQRITVDGTADVADFRLSHAGNRVPLQTKYHAIVDGTSGNTHLQPVEATLGKTPMIVSGAVIGEKNVKGKNIELDALIRNGRLEDVLRLAVKGGTPMTGGINMKTKILIPRGDVHVIDKLGLRGTFAMSGVRFTDPETQAKIDELSQRAQGRPDDETVSHARSRLGAQFRLHDSIVDIAHLKYGVEGAEVELDGSYGLRSEELHFAGVLRLNAKASEMFTGMKSMLLKPFDRLVSRKDRGTVLSIKIEGTREHPKYGLDIGRTLKKKDK